MLIMMIMRMIMIAVAILVVTIVRLGSASKAEDVFDVVVSVAGYGLGTLEPQGTQGPTETGRCTPTTILPSTRGQSPTQNGSTMILMKHVCAGEMYDAPQPQAGERFDMFLQQAQI